MKRSPGQESQSRRKKVAVSVRHLFGVCLDHEEPIKPSFLHLLPTAAALYCSFFLSPALKLLLAFSAAVVSQFSN